MGSSAREMSTISASAKCAHLHHLCSLESLSLVLSPVRACAHALKCVSRRGDREKGPLKASQPFVKIVSRTDLAKRSISVQILSGKMENSSHSSGSYPANIHIDREAFDLETAHQVMGKVPKSKGKICM